MLQQEAENALKQASTIVETNYRVTGEVKLLPLAVSYIQKAMESAWKAREEKEKPMLLKELEQILKNRDVVEIMTK